MAKRVISIPSIAKPLFRFYSSNNSGEIRVGIVDLKVDNVDDFLKDEENYSVQNITMRLRGKSKQQVITSFELKDK